MIVFLSMLAILLYIAGVFIIRWFIGEKTFRRKAYLKEGYRILLSRRIDAYLFDTLAVCFLSPFVFMVLFCGKSALPGDKTANIIVCVLSVLMFLCARLLGKSYALYGEKGLLVSKPFRNIRFVSWSEMGSIQKRHTSAQLYNVYDLTGHQITWFPLNKKTQFFFELAEQHGIIVNVPKEAKMALNNSDKKLNGTLGKWDAVLAQSAYAQNDVISFAAFQGFMVALFIDGRLNTNNIIAINLDGTVRWRISDIVKQSVPVSYAAMTVGSSDTISAMAVLSRQYDCIIYEIDVYEQKIIKQYSQNDV